VEVPEVLWFLGGYIVHVTVGELLFARSLGKAILGLKVVAADGEAASAMAILIRNLVRVPEILTGILLLYILINEHHQRLGDLLARTLVVGQPKPASPASPPSRQPPGAAPKG